MEQAALETLQFSLQAKVTMVVTDLQMVQLLIMVVVVVVLPTLGVMQQPHQGVTVVLAQHLLFLV
jgi:hypothetical protein